MSTIDELKKVRLQKLKLLQMAGLLAYTVTTKRTHSIVEALNGFFNTWSSNFAPYDNPEIVFVATIEGVEGLRAATLPVAHDVLQYYFSKK